jgi:endonuclease/exonuclease/phosphatase family metal-dependent hydrolase
MSNPPGLTVMTFNIRYEEESDGRHAWRHRRALAVEVIRSHEPDLLGLQEPTAAQWAFIAAALPGHSPFGTAENEWGEAEPRGGFFRTARFEAYATGLFWLSETPRVERSVSWPNDWGPRACGWVKLHDRWADRDLLFACTHFDTNAGAWLPSARILHAELDEVAGNLPVILVGDFNCAAGSAAHRYLLEQASFRDAWREVAHSDEGVLTFNGFTPLTHIPRDADTWPQWLKATASPVETVAHDAQHGPAHENYRIDWILLRGSLSAVSAVIDCTSDNGLLPSDHYPVVVHVEYALSS